MINDSVRVYTSRELEKLKCDIDEILQDIRMFEGQYYVEDCGSYKKIIQIIKIESVEYIEPISSYKRFVCYCRISRSDQLYAPWMMVTSYSEDFLKEHRVSDMEYDDIVSEVAKKDIWDMLADVVVNQRH